MIRTVTIFSILLLCVKGLLAQNDGIQRVLNAKVQQISKIQPKKESNTLVLSSSFSEGTLRNVSGKPKGELQTVYYIYTSYRQNASFDQNVLNSERITRLARMIPEVLENRYIEWKIIEQTGCTSPQMGKTFFHGFVLEYRSEVTEKSREQEIQNLEAFFQNPAGGYRTSNDPNVSSVNQQLLLNDESNYSKEDVANSSNRANIDTEANFPEGNFALYEYLKKNIPSGGKIALNRDDEWVAFDMTVDENGKIGKLTFEDGVEDYMKDAVNAVMQGMPDWNPAVKDGASIASDVNLELRMSFSPIVRGMFNRDGKRPEFNQAEIEAAQAKEEAPDEDAQQRMNAAENSAVYRAMDAVIPKEKVAVVMDVTSSMSLHLASMNWWVVNSPDSLNIVHYTFFNDGNNMEDRKKKSGKTGGIYHGEKLKDLPATLMEAMRSGNGGDLVENDFEALLAAQSQDFNADALLLIVDNFSDVRDENLLSQITMKTHVLISGDVTVVRECYLNLAKATGGSILVNGNQINLENVRSTGRITIAESTYVFDGVEFKLL